MNSESIPLLGAAVVAAPALAVSPATAVIPPQVSATSGPAANRAQARAELRRLLADRRLPASARPLHGRPPKLLRQPSQQPGAGRSLLSRAVFVRTGLPLHRVLAWLKHNPPAGLRASGTGKSGRVGPGHRIIADVVSATFEDHPTDAYVYPELLYDAARARDGSGTVWRITATTAWLDPRPWRDQPRHPVRVTAQSGCPASVDGHDGVRNAGAQLRHHLVPDERPSGVSVCVYAGLNGHPAYRLIRHRHGGPAVARRIAEGARNISVSHLDGAVFSCPMDDGSVTVVDLHYRAHRDVDLWYSRSGCSWVGNGVIRSGDAGPRGGRAFFAGVRRLSRPA